MNQPTILICTAVEMEAKAIARQLQLPRAHGQWHAPGVTLVNVGIRASHLDRLSPPTSPSLAASQRDALERPTRRTIGVAPLIIAAGFGGALDPHLAIATVILDDPAQLFATNQLPPNVLRGRIHTADAMIETPAAKAALFARTGALAVDMETALLRAQAQQLGTAFVALRAITDRADEALDPALARIVDDEGRPKTLAIARELLRRPALAADLQKLGKNAAAAADQLAQTVQWLIHQWQGAHPQ